VEKANLDILREALQTQQRNEALERTLGRTVRRHGLDFQKYLEIIYEVRERADKKGIAMEDAAGAILDEQKQQPQQDDHSDHDPSN